MNEAISQEFTETPVMKISVISVCSCTVYSLVLAEGRPGFIPWPFFLPGMTRIRAMLCKDFKIRVRPGRLPGMSNQTAKSSDCTTEKRHAISTW
jgi:hypothetical protein